MPDGTSIEVKCGAYVQAWHTGTERSQIVFGRLSGHTWDPTTRKYSTGRTLNADVYVFCIHTGTDRETWDALDLARWEFFVLPREAVEQIGTRSLSEKRLRSLVTPVSATELPGTVRAKVAQRRNVT